MVADSRRSPREPNMLTAFDGPARADLASELAHRPASPADRRARSFKAGAGGLIEPEKQGRPPLPIRLTGPDVAGVLSERACGALRHAPVTSAACARPEGYALRRARINRL